MERSQLSNGSETARWDRERRPRRAASRHRRGSAVTPGRLARLESL